MLQGRFDLRHACVIALLDGRDRDRQMIDGEMATLDSRGFRSQGLFLVDGFLSSTSSHTYSRPNSTSLHIYHLPPKKERKEKEKKLHPTNLTPLCFPRRASSLPRSRRPRFPQSPAWRPRFPQSLAWRPRSRHSDCSASSSWARRPAAGPPSADARWWPGGRHRTDGTQPMARWGRTRRHFWRPGAAAPRPWRPREGVRRWASGFVGIAARIRHDACRSGSRDTCCRQGGR